MIPRKRPPTHPGGILKRHYLEPLSLAISQVAVALRVSRKTVSKIVNERVDVTPDMALRLAKAFRTTPELWLNLQRNYDLWHASHDSKAWQRARIIRPQSHQTETAFASQAPRNKSL
jgi:addiction module HigA family antidote